MRVSRILPPIAAVAMLAATGNAAAPPGTHARRLPSIQTLLDRHGASLPFDPVLASYACPVERGPVKEGADADRAKVSTSITYSSIKALVGKSKPAHYPTNSRIAPTELRTYQLTGVR